MWFKVSESVSKKNKTKLYVENIIKSALVGFKLGCFIVISKFLLLLLKLQSTRND